jgi:hypothetical protein
VAVAADRPHSHVQSVGTWLYKALGL